MTPCLDSNGTPKGKYDSRRIALEFIKKRHRANPTLDLREYHCKRCGYWHLTHQTDRKEESAA